MLPSGQTLKRLGLYGDGEPNTPIDGAIVDAVWDLGAAATAYKNLGAKTGKPMGTLETEEIKLDHFRRVPETLAETLTMEDAMSGSGYRIMETKALGDPRYLGMEKWQHVHTLPDGTKIVIHFIVDPKSGVRTDFKFK